MTKSPTIEFSWRRGFAAAVLSLAATSVVEARDVALVIGIQNYQHARSLRTARSDAGEIASLLKQRGFTVATALDSAKTQLVEALASLSDVLKSGPVGTVVVYYAGHGVQINGTNYLIPADAAIASAADVPSAAVPVDGVYAALASAQNQTVKLVILDACRPNPFGTLTPLDWVPGLAPPGRSPVNSLTAYATDPGNVASDGAGTHSPFTRALLKWARQPGLIVEEVFKRVRTEVEETTEIQHPAEFSMMTTHNVYFTAPKVMNARILDGDDDVVVLVNGAEVGDWGNDGSGRMTALLSAGTNHVAIKVYNQRSYTGGLPLIGGHLPEGWRYAVVFDIPGVPELALNDREDEPADNGPRHGKLFTAATFDVIVDDLTMGTSVAHVVRGPWRAP